MTPSPRNRVRPARALSRVVGLVAAAFAVTTASAGTLSPEHPVWTLPGIDRPSFLRHLEHVDRERPKSPAVSERGGTRAKAARFGHRVLVVPVLFAGTPTAPLSREQLQEAFFGTGEGSFRGYWSTVSSGRFEPEGLVLPWVRVPDGLSLYRNVLDGRATTNDAGVDLLVRDAMRRAAAVVDDLSLFDADGPDGIPGSGDDDGRVDLLLVLHPTVGFEVEPVTEGPALLAQQGRVEIDPELVAAAGIAADAYVVASALGPLGVWVHEAGHLLGLEDLYDLDVEGPPGTATARGGLGSWSLMASGTWGGGGARPSHLDALSRQLLGWDEVVEVDGPRSLELDRVSPLSTSSVVLRPLGDWGPERFVIENRGRRDGAVVDGDLPGSGVLIYRVDERLRLNRASSGYWLELLQADGRDDLRQLANDGDEGDLFTGSSGSDRLGPGTEPSSRSRTSDASLVPPVVQVDRPRSDGAHPLRLWLGAAGALRLETAFVEDDVRGDRAYLLPQEEALWRLRWREVGEAPVGGATVRLLSVGASLEIEAPDPLVLEQVGAHWELASPLIARALGADPKGFGVEFGLQVDGGNERRVQVGLPVGLGPGLRENALFDFTPRVLSAGVDTTVFAPLPLAELPLSADAGWGLRTGGQRAYANGVDVVLEGPWYAVPEDPRVRLWSVARTEASIPGQAFDGGIMEIYLPDRGWRSVAPDEGPSVHIVERSRASTRGQPGFGGQDGQWERVGASLPQGLLAQRLRLRFGSDATVIDEGWSVAGLNTVSAPATAEVELQVETDGDVVASARLRGSLDGLITLRYRWRRLLEGDWQPASPLLGVRGGALTRTPLELPAGERILRIGLFAEIAAGEAQSPPLLLGEAGLRRPEVVVLPQLLANPARGRAILQIPAQDEELPLRIHDLRGRVVRRLIVPSGTTWIEWDGTDDGGSRVAAGRYFVSLASDPGRAVALTYLP